MRQTKKESMTSFMGEKVIRFWYLACIGKKAPTKYSFTKIMIKVYQYILALFSALVCRIKMN